ncbi:hypothetical protein MIR68_005107 [Amoeboaphelidium protococcarum]|nr:hypothetical protein MIR68_005107 [Amoeboaphelidium protococcarum]
MYIAGDLCDFSEAFDAQSTTTIDTTNMFGAAAVARVCYSAAACWAFQKALFPRTSLIGILTACPRITSNIKMLPWPQQLCIRVHPSTVSGCLRFSDGVKRHTESMHCKGPIVLGQRSAIRMSCFSAYQLANTPFSDSDAYTDASEFCFGEKVLASASCS